jgi:ketosteroid isomerase-like protein
VIRSLLVLVLGALSVSAAAEEEIQKAEKSWHEAVLKRNEAALQGIFSPDVIYAHSTGKIENLTEYLSRLREGKQRYDTFQYEKTTVRIHGQSAVLHAIVRVTGKNDAGPFNDHLMLIHFWVRKGGAWRLVAHQTTKIP